MSSLLSLTAAAPAGHASISTSGIAPRGAGRRLATTVRCEVKQAAAPMRQGRREMLTAGLLTAGSLRLLSPGKAIAGSEIDFKEQVVCDSDCISQLDSIETVTTPSGLQYKDIVKGKGPSPPTGFQVTVHYVAMTPEGKVFASSYESGKPYDVRVGAGQIVPGLDEGLKTMQIGGKRRIYVPGELAFPKGLSSAPGRPRIPPNSPVVFDVNLLLIPGIDPDDYE
eukprot:CAMPEP_0117677598 /NCGR_PEP_ID=MMETSP0804-20121206/16830_1 /TAXON_ID=1074897 /ORGANISM="Tetraselmis astigmatica, Strain CCMP880" /LENGTH=223 /DNA_ID=CAMNT_0005486891 /DNA_START=122 /DNA_END=793 /DNA_ORIENTATION=-